MTVYQFSKGAWFRGQSAVFPRRAGGESVGGTLWPGRKAARRRRPEAAGLFARLCARRSGMTAEQAGRVGALPIELARDAANANARGGLSDASQLASRAVAS